MNENTKILIVEDEILIADYLKNILIEEGYLYVYIANTILEAYSQMQTFLPEIILMDINIDGKNSGIELAKNKNTNARIIYVTAQTEISTLQKAIETKPESYLTKPIKKVDLLAAIELAILNFDTKYVTIKDGNFEIKLHFDEILFITSEKNYIDIQTTTKKYSIRYSLKSFLNEVDPELFCQIHRSIVVNKNHIQKKAANKVIINDVELPVSKNWEI